MLKKILIVIGSFILLLVAAAIIIPMFFKAEILKKVVAEVNKNVNAEVKIADADLTIFRNFPNITLGLQNTSVVGVKEFKGDTLAFIPELDLAFNLWSVLNKGQKELKSITITDPVIQLKVSKSGKANWDILKEDTTTAASTEFKMALKKYTIENAVILYDDSMANMNLIIAGLDHTGKGDFTQDKFLLETESKVDSLTFSYGGMKFLDRVKTHLLADMDMDLRPRKYTFKKNELKLNELLIGLDGYVHLPNDEDIMTDLTFNAKQAEFKDFLSVIPSMYTKDFDDVKATGKMAFNGYVKGITNDKSTPGYKVNLQVENASFRYPDLPENVSDINLTASVNNPDGIPDHTAIDIPKFRMKFGQDPFSGMFKMRNPVTNPRYDADIKGKVNLANLKKTLPLKDVSVFKGIADMDISARNMSMDVNTVNLKDQNIKGKLLLTGFEYKSKDFPEGVSVAQTNINFMPQNLQLVSFIGKVGETDLKMNGTLENPVAYFFDKGNLSGNLNLQSNYVNVNQWMEEEEPTKTSTANSTQATQSESFKIPANINFVINTRANKLLYDNMDIRDFIGTVTIKDRGIKFSEVKMKALGGEIAMNGDFITPESSNSMMDIDLQLIKLNIPVSYKTLMTIQKFAPIAEYTDGSYSVKINLKGELDKNMNPVWNTLTGLGSIEVLDALVKNFKPVAKLAKELQLQKLNPFKVKNFNALINIANGKIFVKPFDLSIDDINMNVSGYNAVDKTLEYVINMQVPREKMGSKATGVINNLKGQAAAKGINFQAGDVIKMAVIISGSIVDPKIKVSLQEMAADLKNEIQDQAKEQLDLKKQELENMAKEKTDEIKKEAEDKVRAEAEKARRDAEKKAQARVDSLKKVAEDKVKKKGSDVFKKIIKP